MRSHTTGGLFLLAVLAVAPFAIAQSAPPVPPPAPPPPAPAPTTTDTTPPVVTAAPTETPAPTPTVTPGPTVTATPTVTPAPEVTSAPPPAEEREPRPARLHLFAEYTVGFGKVDAIQQRILPSLATRPENILGQSQVSVSTFIVGGSFDITEGFGAGVRVPFTYGALGNITSDSAHTIIFGNLELFATLKKRFSPSFELFGSLAIGLPTSLGTELPRTQAELAAYPADTFDRAEANRFSINQAAAAAFGYEQDQLFWSKRFGLTPAIEARWSHDKVHIEPFLKMPNLIDTHSSSVEPYRLELVFGAAGGYRALPWLDLGLRAWGSAAIARREASPVGGGALSPEVKFVFGARNPTVLYVAAVLPFVGSNVDPWYFGALRAGISGSF